MNKRQYIVEVNFESSYEARNALTAIDLCVPDEDTHIVFNPENLHSVVIEIWHGCFRDKEKSRPDIMPTNFQNEHEARQWSEISNMLIESGMYIQSYVEEVKDKQWLINTTKEI